jgi:flagellar biosynthesis protein FliR
VIEVTFDQLQIWLAMFLWPFTRITAFFAASPLWGHSSVPNEAKVGLAALIAICANRFGRRMACCRHRCSHCPKLLLG